MQYRKLGNSGLSVSNITLGTMGFGTETPEKEAFAIIDAFLDAGGNMLDTADVYGGGVSEELIGRWKASRSSSSSDRVVIATKARFGTGADVNDVGNSRRHLDRALNTSLSRLGVESIDLYQMHGWDSLTPVEETLTFLDAATRAGKIHYVGLSNYTGWQLQLMVSTAKSMGLQLPVTLQQQYSLACREIEYEVIPAALHNNIGLLPWSPLAHGFLSGKFTQDAELPENVRLNSGNPMFNYIKNSLFNDRRNWETLSVIRDIADVTGHSPSQISLSWVTNRPSVTSTIIGARTMSQLKDDIVSADLILENEHVSRLNEISCPTPDDYPYGLFGTLQRERYLDSSDQALRELP